MSRPPSRRRHQHHHRSHSLVTEDGLVQVGKHPMREAGVRALSDEPMWYVVNL